MSQVEPSADGSPKPRCDVTAKRSKPHSDWVCGYAQMGQCCASGPSADGRCGRLLQPQTASGEQVPPCIPRRGHRWRRDALKVNLAVMIGGLLLLCLALPTRESIFVPGELSGKHAQILNNTLVSQRCSSCHPTAHGQESVEEAPKQSNSNWFTKVALETAHSLVENDGRQDKLCMQCHQSHMPAAAGRLAHDLTPEQWKAMRADQQAPAWQLVSTSVDDGQFDAEAHESASMPTSCAMCHIEHHGRQFDLKLMSNSRCQACHQRQFESLASGHPEFTNFPVDRPRALMFSHARHQGEHFGKKNRDFDCKACHVTADHDGLYGAVSRSLSFESACASCHDAPIRAASIEGWAVLQVPSIEPSAASHNPALAGWPTSAQYGSDGDVSPVLRALLMADDKVASALASLPSSGKIVDISTISDKRSSIAELLAVATQALIKETARDGQAAWVRRLELVTKKHLKRELSSNETALISKMTSGLPPDLFRLAVKDWFETIPKNASRLNIQLAGTTQDVPPDLKSAANDNLLVDETSVLGDDDNLLTEPPSMELPQQRKAPAGPLPIKGATHVSGGGWYVDQATLSIRYLPTGHADPVQSAWIQWWSLIEPRAPQLVSALVESSPMPHASRVPGGCTQCHQVTGSQLDLSAFRVRQRSRADKEFTKFNHTPHLALPAVNDCRFCHELVPGNTSVSVPPGNDRLVSLKPLDPHPQATSEFIGMKLHQCASCHRPNGANDGCLQCHNYHISDSQVGQTQGGRSSAEPNAVLNR